jgi:hypothetical protein
MIGYRGKHQTAGPGDEGTSLGVQPAIPNALTRMATGREEAYRNFPMQLEKPENPQGRRHRELEHKRREVGGADVESVCLIPRVTKSIAADAVGPV